VLGGEGEKYMSRQSDKKTSKQVRIDSGLHQLLKIEAAKSNRSIKELLEESLAEYLAVDKR
jgi:predicted HicB family RNase H-like nuclease